MAADHFEVGGKGSSRVYSNSCRLGVEDRRVKELGVFEAKNSASRNGSGGLNLGEHDQMWTLIGKRD